MATEIQKQTITTRFEHAKNGHYNKIFYQPLYYVSNNLSQVILEKNKSIDFKKEMLDEKLQFYPETDIKFEMTVSESISPENDSIDNIKLNFVLDRYNTNLNFKYDGADFTIKTDNLIKQYPVNAAYEEKTISSTYEITCNSEDLEKFNRFIKESILYYHKHFEGITEDNNKTTMYISSSDGSYFEYLGKRNKRSLDTIYLPHKQKKDIIDDLTKFLAPTTKQKYEKLGINYKRIYLLEGKPGSGKTSLIIALAAKFEYDIAIVSFTPKMTDVNLIRALRSLTDEKSRDDKPSKKKKFFIVFEDMDCIFKERKHNDENKNAITFSGLLNAMDGITTNEMIGFITTNYKHNLDSALIRPGRIDYIMNFDNANKEQIMEIFKVYTCEFYESLNNDEIIRNFYDELQSLNIKISTSLLQQYLLKYVDSPENAIKNLSELKKMYDSCQIKSFEGTPDNIYN